MPDDIGLAITDLLAVTPKDPTGQYYITSRGRIPVSTYQRWLNSEQGRQWVNSYYLLLDNGSQDRVLAGYMPDSVPLASYKSGLDLAIEQALSYLNDYDQQLIMQKYGVTDYSALDDAQKATLFVEAKGKAEQSFQSRFSAAYAKDASNIKVELRSKEDIDKEESAAYRAMLSLTSKLQASKTAEGDYLSKIDPGAYQRWLESSGTGEVSPVVRQYITIGAQTIGRTLDYGTYEAEQGLGYPRVSNVGNIRQEVVEEEAGTGAPSISAFAEWYKSQPGYSKYKQSLVQRYKDVPYLAAEYESDYLKSIEEGTSPVGFEEWIDLEPARKAEYEKTVESNRYNRLQRERAASYTMGAISPKAKFLRY